MKAGDLVKVEFPGPADYYGIILGFYPYIHAEYGGDYKILFCDGEVALFTQDTIDYEKITIEVISESR